jgi:CNT family concentrative nucleoside transporter
MLANVVVADAPLSFARIAGWLFAPLVWLIGIPWNEAATAGSLMGTKTILNEFIAYLNLAALPPEALSARSELLMLYAMCGFANLSSVGMVIAGVSALAPARRDEIVQLSLWSIIPGTLSTCMTAAVVGLLP